MLAKRIIPCLDVKNSRVVKGNKFKNLQDIGDPLEMAIDYDNQKADELVFLDISASLERRQLQMDLVKKLAKKIFIPFSIGGGLNNVVDIIDLVQSGADKVVINSGAIANPNLISQVAQKLGSQCVVVAIDVKKKSDRWQVYDMAGERNTGLDAIEWAHKAVKLGAGEIILTSIDKDGTKTGFDLDITAKLSLSLSVPIIASGGVGKIEHFKEAFTIGLANGALAASVFHKKKLSIEAVKTYLKKNNITIRQ